MVPIGAASTTLRLCIGMGVWIIGPVKSSSFLMSDDDGAAVAVRFAVGSTMADTRNGEPAGGAKEAMAPFA